MFKVGDIVKVVNGRRGDRYRVISIYSDGNGLILRNIHQTLPKMNFYSNNSDNHLKLDEIYQRNKKIEKLKQRYENKEWVCK